MPQFHMVIDGEPIAGKAVQGVVNPATGEVEAQVPTCSEHQLDLAMAAAQHAYQSWRSDEDLRRSALGEASAKLFAAVDEIADVLTMEQGKPLRDAAAEVKGAAVWLKYFARLAIPRETIQDNDAAHVEVTRRPLGVVAAITPWNFPILLAAWKIGPALLAGNTVVLKPSPYTPASTLKLAELLIPVLPPGVLNVVSGDGALGQLMVEHAVPRKVSFTGSVATGKRVAATAAHDLKRTTLELGGNDAAIVLDDVEPDAVIEKLFWNAFANNGQVCSAIKRVYVPEHLRPKFVDGLADCARAAKVGDGRNEDTRLGPVNNEPQLHRVAELVAAALSDGATAAAGGKRIDRPGYFFEPTILTELNDTARIVNEEQFGPALPVVGYRDIDEAIHRANDTHFGLAGSVWAADEERGKLIASRLECGTAWVNTHMALAPHQPFGGMKWSGVGVENGRWAIDEHTELQVIHSAKR